MGSFYVSKVDERWIEKVNTRCKSFLVVPGL